jgi:nucleoside-diphosphate-sugar epimerase
LITGGTGFVGKHLTRLLLQWLQCFDLKSDKKKNMNSVFYYTWDVKKQVIEKSVLNADYIIHLAEEYSREALVKERKVS